MQVVISDKRISVCDNELQTERFEADILMATDYYPFGMVSLFEIQHGYFGLTDNNENIIPAKGCKPDFYGGHGYHQIGYGGDAVNRVNTYRKQLDLPLRMTYEALDIKVLFWEKY